MNIDLSNKLKKEIKNMCRFKSAIILKNKVVLAPESNESHSDLLEELGIDDTYTNASKKFVRVELIPKDNNKATDVAEWRYNVDQDVKPDWYEKDPERYEQEFRDAVKEYMKDRIIIMGGMAWSKIKEDEDGTYYLLDGFLENKAQFGENNDYRSSYIREKLNNSELTKNLKAEFGERLVPISTNLLSLDGLDDYGTAEGDILALPTINLYRECRKNIPNADGWWWLATPDSAPSGYSSVYVQIVLSSGDVGYCHSDYHGGVRPFCIIKS